MDLISVLVKDSMITNFCLQNLYFPKKPIETLSFVTLDVDIAERRVIWQFNENFMLKT